jgi:hypothetical protein
MTTPTHATVTTSPITATALFSRTTASSSEAGPSSTEHDPATSSLHCELEGVEDQEPGTSTFIQRQGMERGYALSPMAHLWLEFGHNTEKTNSTSTRAMGLATKRSLKMDEMVDQGPAFESLGRFHLQDRLTRNVAQTVEELQTFIKKHGGSSARASALLHRRPRRYSYGGFRRSGITWAVIGSLASAVDQDRELATVYVDGRHGEAVAKQSLL